MTKIRLKYINAYKDRHGKMRWYYRRRGKKVALPGLPGSTEFMAAYQSALSSSSTPSEIGAGRTRPGTVAAVVAGYFASRAFRDDLAERTKQDRRRALEKFREDFGDGPIASLRRAHIEKIMEQQSSPAKALHFLIDIRELMRFAVRMGLRNDDPTQDIKRPKLKGDGLYAWTDEDMAKFEVAHPIGTRARLAMALGLYLGQRRSDVIRMGWQHVRGDGVIVIRQQKTGTPLLIPIHPKLQTVLDSVPRDRLTFVLTQYNKPFGPSPFSDWFHTECQKAGLPKAASFHGLRKAAARRLAEAGCSASVIASITGHKSLREVARYTAEADQLRLAKMGIETVS